MGSYTNNEALPLFFKSFPISEFLSQRHTPLFERGGDFPAFLTKEYRLYGITVCYMTRIRYGTLRGKKKVCFPSVTPNSRTHFLTDSVLWPFLTGRPLGNKKWSLRSGAHSSFIPYTGCRLLSTSHPHLLRVKEHRPGTPITPEKW